MMMMKRRAPSEEVANRIVRWVIQAGGTARADWREVLVMSSGPLGESAVADAVRRMLDGEIVAAVVVPRVVDKTVQLESKRRYDRRRRVQKMMDGCVPDTKYRVVLIKEDGYSEILKGVYYRTGKNRLILMQDFSPPISIGSVELRDVRGERIRCWNQVPIGPHSRILGTIDLGALQLMLQK